MIHPTAIIYPNVVLGKNVWIGAYSVIGAPAEVKGKPQQVMGKVYINSNTVIREFVTVHSPSSDISHTYIGSNCYIQAHSHIGHDAYLDDYITISCYACVGGHCNISQYVNLGLHSVLHQRSKVDAGIMLGANAFGKGHLSEPFMVYVGTPAKPIKPNQYLIDKLKKDEA